MIGLRLHFNNSNYNRYKSDSSYRNQQQELKRAVLELAFERKQVHPCHIMFPSHPLHFITRPFRIVIVESYEQVALCEGEHDHHVVEGVGVPPAQHLASEYRIHIGGVEK